MCGIMGYVGPRSAAPIIVEGLRRLEYRGYDSAGVAVAADGTITVRKAQGKLSRLEEMLTGDSLPGSLGIGHTRWATHGRPSDINAHPHSDASGRFVVVHNGIIENFTALKEELASSGHEFASETDTEVLAHLIADEYEGDLVAAIRQAVARAEGAYALAAMAADEPDRIVAVRMVSPLVVGFGDGESFLASDIPAIIDHTRKVVIVEDGELVIVTAAGATIERVEGGTVDRAPWHVDWDVEQAEKRGLPHFMLKEIYEQPAAVAETLAGRIEPDGSVLLDGVDIPEALVEGMDRVWITACGTAYNAGLLGKSVVESLLRVPVEVAYAHEMRYGDPLVDENSLTIAISQSGETADTLVAARLAQERGSRLLAITNVVGSSLSRQADDVLYTRAGPEIAVASTKAYSTMLIGQYLLALALGRARRAIDSVAAAAIAQSLLALSTQVAEVLEQDQEVADMAHHLASVEDIYFIGRGLDYAVATEGSLKLKEISYIHSEAMPAGELKHGTLALITEGTPVVAVLTQQKVYDKTMSGIEEVKARGARVIAVAYDDDHEISKHIEHVLRIPRTEDLVSPVLSIVPLQLIAYHVARERGHDIDQPRNLAKSVTVE